MKGTQAGRLFIWLCLLCIVVERLLWPAVASWREDQASLVWIAGHIPLREWTVGLTSSAEVPNPNGLLFLSRVLSWLPNLYWSGVFMQIGQLICIAYFVTGVAFQMTRWAQLWLFVVVASSFTLSANGSEPHGQYVLIWANLLYLGTALRALRQPSVWTFAALILMWFVGPAIYLPGLLNTLMWSAIAGGVFWKHRKWIRAHQPNVPALAGLTVGVAVVGYFVWVPYFRSAPLFQTIRSVHVVAMPIPKRVFWSLASFATAPVTWLLRPNVPLFGQSIYRDLAVSLSRVFVMTGWIYATTFALLGLLSLGLEFKAGEKLFPILVMPVWLAFGLSPLIGGPRFILGERPDLFPQFLPLSLAVFFLFRQRYRLIDWGLGVMIVAQLVAAAISIHVHLTYRGPVLTDADAPLAQKMAVVDWIANDWATRSQDTTVPVHFDVGAGRWDWIPRIGSMMPAQYHHPYTIGRGFDYLLERQYRLRNAQEGLLTRTNSGVVYVVNYTFQPPPFDGAGEMTVLGRYRVTRNPAHVSALNQP